MWKIEVSDLYGAETQAALEAAAQVLGVALSENGRPITVTQGEKFALCTETADATLCIGRKVELFRALSFLAGAQNTLQIEQTPCFDTLGFMIDVSRNAALTVKAVKKLLLTMAFMGFNIGMMYTEDVYEVENEPFFGYMRGRYSRSELRELDAYPMSAQVLSQFDLPMTAEISWQLSADIHGTQALSCAQMADIGVTIDAADGTIVVSAAAKTDAELFVTAKHSEKVFAVKHVKLSDLPAAAQTIAFVDSPQKALRGKNTVLRAAVFDQYGKETTAKIHYQLSADITGNEEFHCAYGAMDENGVLTVNENAPQRLCLIATAHTDLPQGKLCCSCVLCVE